MRHMHYARAFYPCMKRSEKGKHNKRSRLSEFAMKQGADIALGFGCTLSFWMAWSSWNWHFTRKQANIRSMPIISSCFYTHRSSTAVKMVFNMYGCHGSHGYGRTHRAQRPTANARNGFIHLMCAVARCIYLDIIQSPCSCSCSIILYAPVKPSGVDLFFAGGLCNAALVNFT